MGGSGKWVKALLSLRKPEEVGRHDKMGCEGQNRKLWRKSLGELGFRWKGLKTSHGTASRRCESSDIAPFTAASATLARAPPPDFRVARQEWAATRIQTAFRAFLARRALRALKGVVRIQALVRGRQVRKQAAVTLRCMQAIVRVQAHIRAGCIRRSSEGQAVQHILDQHRRKTDRLRQAEEGWCCGNGTLEDIKANMQFRQEGVIRRDRAAAYSLTQKMNSKCRSLCSVSPSNEPEFDRGRSWLQNWMAAESWDTRLTANPLPKRFAPSAVKLDTGPCSVSVWKNNVATRISAKPPQIGKFSPSSSSPSSESFSGGSRLTTSTVVKIERSIDRPNYMNSTKSSKGKLKSSSHSSLKVRRQAVDARI